MSDSVIFFREALKYFESPALAQRWLITPNDSLNGKKPLEVLNEDGGAELLRNNLSSAFINQRK